MYKAIPKIFLLTIAVLTTQIITSNQNIYADTHIAYPNNITDIICDVTGNKPVTIIENDDNITIIAYISIKGPATYDLYPDTNITFKQAVTDGIIENWSGYYQDKPVSVHLIDIDTPEWKNISDFQKIIPINVFNYKKKSNIITSPDDLNYIQRLDLYTGDENNNHMYDLNEFKHVAAHEFGHALGLDDAYKDPEILPSFKSIMRQHLEDPQPIDYELAIYMHKHNMKLTYGEYLTS